MPYQIVPGDGVIRLFIRLFYVNKGFVGPRVLDPRVVDAAGVNVIALMGTNHTQLASQVATATNPE